MSWVQKLYETYENNQSNIGYQENVEGEESAILLPIFHTLTKIHMEVTIDDQGSCLSARLLGKDGEITIIPCSEESDGRSGKMPKPHPLNDKLQYLAGDYLKYGGTKWHGYSLYVDKLTEWVESENSHPILESILGYVKKGCLIEDLIKHGVMCINQENSIDEKWDKDRFPNSPSTKPDEIHLRWKVERVGELETRTWRDEKLYNSWINYYLKSLDGEGYCQITGKQVPLAKNHPKKIFNYAANAKLISANDTSGFTFRGRFVNSDEVYGLGSETSQKAHLALKWLISKQGYNRDKKSFLCWRLSSKGIPNIFQDSFGLFDEEDIESSTGSNLSYTGEDIADRFRKAISGYKQTTITNDKVILSSFESATDGRLSITYYQELEVDDFFERIELWYKTCQWTMYNHKRVYIGSPSPRDIVDSVYGYGKQVSDKLVNQTIERILPCIVEVRKIPLDLVANAVRNASRPESFEEKQRWQYEKTLNTACALYKKYAWDYKKEELKLALDNERKNRDYLYGRLLAVAASIERSALSAAGESRQTNADRLMHRFSEHPFSTWKSIELSLKPSLNRLRGKAIRKEKILDEIMGLFEPNEFVSDTKLSGEFLLGYHCQRQELYKKYNDVTIDELNDEEEEVLNVK